MIQFRTTKYRVPTLAGDTLSKVGDFELNLEREKYSRMKFHARSNRDEGKAKIRGTLKRIRSQI